MDKSEINKRFIHAIELLLQDKALTKSKIAESLGVKPAKFSEILNNRMNAGVDLIALLCEKYCYSAAWIINGQGPILQPGEIKGRSKPSIAVPKLPDFPLTSDGVCEMFIEILRDKDMRFREQAEEIGRLKERIAQLEREKGKNASDAQTSDVANVG